MTYIIGISSLNRDSTTSLITTDGRLLAVISEDRFTRVKQQGGFPHNGMRYIFDKFELTPDKIDSVCYSFMRWDDEQNAIMKSAELDRIRGRNGVFDPFGKYLHKRAYDRWNEDSVRYHRQYNDELFEGLKRFGLADKVRFYHHHYSHAASAYYLSGYDEALIVSID